MFITELLHRSYFVNGIFVKILHLFNELCGFLVGGLA